MSRFLTSRVSKLLGRCARIYTTETSFPSQTVKRRRFSKSFLGILAGGVATCGAVIYALDQSIVHAGELVGHPPAYPWSFKKLFASLDHAAVRRGWIVYKTICATCHSIQWVCFRDFVDVIMSEEEAKAYAAQFEVRDGPDEEGNYYMRPGKLTDRVPGPFPNEEAARFANNGSYPVDLSFVIPGRHNGTNYLFGLLTGYVDKPVGLELAEGRHYNVYFEGGSINMAPPLFNGAVEYEDDAEPTVSQMAKDVTEFLSWTSDQSWDSRVVICSKYLLILIIAFAFTYPIYKKKMNTHRHAVVQFVKKTYPKT